MDTKTFTPVIKTTDIQRTATGFIKPSELIDVYEVSPLTLTDRRIFNELIANAWESISEDKEHTISKAALKGSMKGNERIEDTIRKLMGAIVETKITINGEPGTERVQLLGYNKSVNQNDGLLYYRFPAELRRLIANSNIWAKIERDVMFAFTSKYALALYEIVQKRRNLRIQREKFSVDEIRRLLGVPPKKLKLFGDLNKYALKKAIKPIIAVIGLGIGRLLGGAVFVEVIFNRPGLGRLIVDSVNERDLPLVRGGVLVAALLFVIANLIADISYAYFDPRIKQK
jgi:hypothetical protein